MVESKKIITLEKAKELAAHGWHAADLHVHTRYSYDVLPSPLLNPVVLYEKGRMKGLRFITFTDHDTMEAYDHIGWEREGLVPGVEIKIRDRRRVGHTLHINVYQLNRVQFGELTAIAKQEKDIELFLRYLADHDLPHIYNHPYWFEAHERPSYSVINDLIRRFPVTEYNMHRVMQKNNVTFALAERYGKGIVAATDTHAGDIGRAFTLARGETFRDFYENIKRGDSLLVPRDLTIGLLKHEINTWIELIFAIDMDVFEKTKFTGTFWIDQLIITLARGTLKEYPRMWKAANYFFSTLSKSGAPAFFYVKTQHLKARKMKRHLR